jgi:hypothetical protein
MNDLNHNRDPGTRAPNGGAGRDWRDRAACRGSTDAELFFPTAEAGPARAAQVAAAKAICARCPVIAECLAEALVRIPYGICGGLTESERRRLRARDHAPSGHPTWNRQGIGRRGGLSAEATELLTDGPGQGMSARQRGRLGRELLADGRRIGRVAAACRVSERTVQRWAATHRDPGSDRSTGAGIKRRASVGGGGRGAAAATGLPSGSPTAIGTQAGTPAAEEGRA